MLPSLLQDLIMAPVHLVEGLSVRFGFFRALYRGIAPIYGLPRPWLRFGEDLFLGSVGPGDKALEIGAGTGFLSRMVARKASLCVGLEAETAMVKRAVRQGEGARYVAGRMETLPFRAGAFDKCLCLGALHCADPLVVAAAVFQALRSGGEFLLLIEARVIPLFAKAAGRVEVRRALEEQGFAVVDERSVGRLYVWLRARKPC